jgi:hypothetical protein
MIGRRAETLVKDQTPEYWLKKYVLDVLGTGIIIAQRLFEFTTDKNTWLIPNKLEEQSPDTIRMFKTIIQEVEYTKLIEIGEQNGIVAFKWIPEGRATYEQIIQEVKECENVICIKRCAKLGCLCVNEECS